MAQSRAPPPAQGGRSKSSRRRRRDLAGGGSLLRKGAVVPAALKAAPRRPTSAQTRGPWTCAPVDGCGCVKALEVSRTGGQYPKPETARGVCSMKRPPRRLADSASARFACLLPPPLARTRRPPHCGTPDTPTPLPTTTRQGQGALSIDRSKGARSHHEGLRLRLLQLAHAAQVPRHQPVRPVPLRVLWSGRVFCGSSTADRSIDRRAAGGLCGRLLWRRSRA